MNRLTNYLTSARLAKAFLLQADEDYRKNQVPRAVKNLIGAVYELVQANNNLASIAFNKKPKGARR